MHNLDAGFSPPTGAKTVSTRKTFDSNLTLNFVELRAHNSKPNALSSEDFADGVISNNRKGNSTNTKEVFDSRVTQHFCSDARRIQLSVP